MRPLMARAVGAGAVALTLAGCAVPVPPSAGYAPALPEYRPAIEPSAPQPSPAARRLSHRQAAPEPYRPQPAAVVQPAPADPPARVEPTPLIPVEPVGMYRVDQGCSGWWAICHFF
jgi:general secretion pathway protein B